jgi:SAM-dependent methyltransferase
MDLVSPRSVLDVGCGVGTWLLAFQENGIQDLAGIDGDHVRAANFLVDPSLFHPQDLSKLEGVMPPRTADLVVSLEVAEHLPTQSSAAFVRFLTACAPLVLFSAAIPGQGGTNHINEQWPAYWEALFKKQGFTRLDPIRRHIWQDHRVEWWYQQNIYLYASRDAIRALPTLQQEATAVREQHLELVHSNVLGQLSSVRGTLAAFFTAVLRAIGRRFSGSSS